MADFVHVKPFYAGDGWVVLIDELIETGPFTKKSEAIDEAKIIGNKKQLDIYIHNKSNSGARILDYKNVKKIPQRVDIDSRARELHSFSESLSKAASIDKIYITKENELRKDEIVELKGRLYELSEEVKTLKVKNKYISREFHELTYKHQQGFQREILSEIQYVPVIIYLSNENNVENISLIIANILSDLGIEFSDEYDVQFGSIWKKWIAASKNQLKRINLTKELEKFIRTYNNLIHKKNQSEIDKNNSETLLNLHKIMECQDRGVILMGGVIIAKDKDNNGQSYTMAKVLSNDDLEYLERNQDIVKTPNKLLERLRENN